VAAARLRAAARAIILDEHDRILLCRFEFPRLGDPVVVWATPGGGVEQGETLLATLRRELLEEVGLELVGEPPLVWHQEVIGAEYLDGYDGVINDFFLVRTTAFTPRGAMTDEELAAENVTAWRWWTLAEIAGYRGSDLFGPRDLARLLGGLVEEGLPGLPIQLGL
jgi:8-oxo-dGTP diphosphatase